MHGQAFEQMKTKTSLVLINLWLSVEVQGDITVFAIKQIELIY